MKINKHKSFCISTGEFETHLDIIFTRRDHIIITPHWFVIRLFGWQFYAKDNKVVPIFSERYGYTKYNKVGKWRWSFGKLT